MKKILSAVILTLIMGGCTTGIKCPIFTDPEEGNAYTEQQLKENGYADYTFVESMDDLKQNQNKQEQPVQQEQAQSKPVKTCSHNYEVEIVKEATCSEDGEMKFTCSMCGDTYKEVIAKTGKHEYEETVTKEPTCTENGEKTLTCKNCPDTLAEEIRATGHEYESKVTKEVTCTEEGELTYTCKKCGDTYTETVTATGHTEEEWQMTKKSGMFKKGLKEQVCASCGEVINTEVILSRCPIAYLYAGIGAVIALAIGAVVFRNNRSKALNEKGDLYDF